VAPESLCSLWSSLCPMGKLGGCFAESNRRVSPLSRSHANCFWRENPAFSLRKLLITITTPSLCLPSPPFSTGNRATCVPSSVPDGTSSWPSQSLRYRQARVTRSTREDTHASGSGLIPVDPAGGLVNGHDDGHHTAPVQGGDLLSEPQPRSRGLLNWINKGCLSSNARTSPTNQPKG
jgi:hypothetical protein